MDDLLTLDEISDLLGVSRQRAQQLLTEDEDPLPPAVIVKSNGKIRLWAGADVRVWAKRNQYPRRRRRGKRTPLPPAE